MSKPRKLGPCPKHALALKVVDMTPEIARLRCPQRWCRHHVLIPTVWLPMTTAQGKWELTIKPGDDDSGLLLCLDDDGLTLCVSRQGLLVEVQIPAEEFTALCRRWLADDFDAPKE